MPACTRGPAWRGPRRRGGGPRPPACHGVRRVGAHGDVAVGIDERRRIARQQREGTVGDPALAHPVEVEPDGSLAVHDTATRVRAKRPAGRGRRGIVASLGGQARSQQAHVNDALRALRDRLRSSQDRAEGRPDAGMRRPGLAVEHAQVRIGLEAGQASCPGFDPRRDQPQIAVCPAGLLLVTGDVQAHAAPHGREHEAASRRGRSVLVAANGVGVVTAVPGAAVSSQVVILPTASSWPRARASKTTMTAASPSAPRHAASAPPRG